MFNKNGKPTELFRHISDYTDSDRCSEDFEFNHSFPAALSELFANETGLHIIGARPARGKTTLMLQKALDCANSSNVYIYEAEENREKIIQRMSTILTGSTSETDLYIAREYVKAFLKKSNIYLCTQCAAIEEIFEELKNKSGIVFIDYLQLLYTQTVTESREEERRIILENLRKLGSNKPVYVFSQLNREADAIRDCPPSPESLRFYKNIGDYADTVTTFANLSCEDETGAAVFSVYDKNSAEPAKTLNAGIDDSTGLFIDCEPERTGAKN